MIIKDFYPSESLMLLAHKHLRTKDFIKLSVIELLKLQQVGLNSQGILRKGFNFHEFTNRPHHKMIKDIVGDYDSDLENPNRLAPPKLNLERLTELINKQEKEQSKDFKTYLIYDILKREKLVRKSNFILWKPIFLTKSGRKVSERLRFLVTELEKLILENKKSELTFKAIESELGFNVMLSPAYRKKFELQALEDKSEWGILDIFSTVTEYIVRYPVEY